MLKRMICLLLALLMLPAMLTAAAEPRYPSQNGVTTDAAAVLSHKLLEDLRTLDDKLDKADTPRLRIATVDFLDGTAVEDYAAALFDRWKLDDEDMLLLMAVGEDKYALVAGRDADRLVSASVRSKLLAAAFSEPFLQQRYDEALSAFVPALVQEINKACGSSVSTDGLFGRTGSASLFDNWAANLQRLSDDDNDESIFTREDKRTGFSFLKVVGIVFVLMLVFGSFRKSKGKKSRRRASHPYAANRRPFGPGRRRR